MIEGMEYCIGKKLKQEYIEEYYGEIRSLGHINTRPGYCSPNMHINMMIYFDKDYRISEIEGSKCYSYYRGMYNRSSAVYDRPFSKRDIAYLRAFIKRITE